MKSKFCINLIFSYLLISQYNSFVSLSELSKVRKDFKITIDKIKNDKKVTKILKSRKLSELPKSYPRNLGLESRVKLAPVERYLKPNDPVM